MTTGMNVNVRVWQVSAALVDPVNGTARGTFNNVPVQTGIPTLGGNNNQNVTDLNFGGHPFFVQDPNQNKLINGFDRQMQADGLIRFQGNVFAVPTDPASRNDIFVLLNPNMFGGNDNMPRNVSELTRLGYRVSTTRSTGMNTAIHSVQFENRDGFAAVRIRFARELVSVSDHDFEFDVRINNTRQAHTSDIIFRVEGNFRNVPTHISDRYDDVCTAHGEVIFSEDFIRDVTFYAGVGVNINLNTYDDTRYYARAFMVENPGTITDHRAIEGIIHINTAASRNATFRSARVDLNTARTYYVFNEDFQYIGLSTDRGLPFSNRFYLSTDRNWAGAAGGTGPDEIPVIDDAVLDPSNPVTGGDSTPANVNENPGTGR